MRTGGPDTADTTTRPGARPPPPPTLPPPASPTLPRDEAPPAAPPLLGIAALQLQVCATTADTLAHIDALLDSECRRLGVLRWDGDGRAIDGGSGGQHLDLLVLPEASGDWVCAVQGRVNPFFAVAAAIPCLLLHAAHQATARPSPLAWKPHPTTTTTHAYTHALQLFNGPHLVCETAWYRAERLDGAHTSPSLAALATWAARYRCYVAATLLEATSDGHIYNSLVLVAPDGSFVVPQHGAGSSDASSVALLRKQRAASLEAFVFRGCGSGAGEPATRVINLDVAPLLAKRSGSGSGGGGGSSSCTLRLAFAICYENMCAPPMEAILVRWGVLGVVCGLHAASVTVGSLRCAHTHRLLTYRCRRCCRRHTAASPLTCWPPSIAQWRHAPTTRCSNGPQRRRSALRPRRRAPLACTPSNCGRLPWQRTIAAHGHRHCRACCPGCRGILCRWRAPCWAVLRSTHAEARYWHRCAAARRA